MKLSTGRAALASRGRHGWFENAPGWMFYAPVVIQWLLLGVRHGSWSLPTLANPTLELGGLTGESKSRLLAQLTPETATLVAPWIAVAANNPVHAEAARLQAGLAYPMIAKPDIGCNGAGVRVIHNQTELAGYCAAFPRGEQVMLQALVTLPLEAGLFYVRAPGAARGCITSLTLKAPPIVVGTGRSTIATLIAADPRLRHQRKLLLRHLGKRAASVPEAGETVPLVFVGNHRRGAIFTDGQTHITPALEWWTDTLAQGLPGFRFGRIDVRFATLADLHAGSGLVVLEINGVGSEATHIWDPAMRLIPAMRSQLWHFGMAWRIAAAHRRLGARPPGVPAMARAWRRQRRLMAAYPPND